jgi:hypothetical protein
MLPGSIRWGSLHGYERVNSLEDNEVFILARSADRKAKEQAMHQRFFLRLEDGLRKLQSTMATGHLKDEGLG